MLFTKEEIEILNDMNCYEDALKLTEREIDGEEETYINNSDYWNMSLKEWFIDYLNERIYTMALKDGKELYIFDNSDDDIYCDRKLLLKRLFDNYEITNSEDFDEVVVKLEDEFNLQVPTKQEKDLLKKVYGYDLIFDLAERWKKEADLEEYISYFGNLKYKFEDWFFDNEVQCEEIKSIYLYIDIIDMFIPEKRKEILNQILNIFNKYNIYNADDLKQFKNKYLEG